MASHRRSYFLTITVIAALLMAVLIALLPTPALAHSGDEAYATVTPLIQFARSMRNGRDEITGVYVPNLFALPVVEQPASDFTYVSTAENAITEFGLASEYNNVGLLAHNFLAGRNFFSLTLGERLYLVHGTGRTEAFTVTDILRYQALDPESPYSEFRDLATGSILSATEMFNRVYTGKYHLTFQTCIDQDGNPSWGRIFVVAEPVVSPSK